MCICLYMYIYIYTHKLTIHYIGEAYIQPTTYYIGEASASSRQAVGTELPGGER